MQALFQRIRAQYCSRCFGLFAMRYDELKGSAALDCPACLEFYSGLVVSAGQLTLEDKVLDSPAGPFATFAEARLRERERELQFMTGTAGRLCSRLPCLCSRHQQCKQPGGIGVEHLAEHPPHALASCAGDICGSGWQKRPGRTLQSPQASPAPPAHRTLLPHRSAPCRCPVGCEMRSVFVGMEVPQPKAKRFHCRQVKLQDLQAQTTGHRYQAKGQGLASMLLRPSVLCNTVK